jgi:hypothetical protein
MKLTLFILLFSICAKAQNDTVKPNWLALKGYIKDLQSISFVDNIDSIAALNLIHNRLNFKLTFNEKLSAKVEVRNRIFYGDQIKKIPDFGNYINRNNALFNLSKLWINEKTLVLHSVIDRLFLQYSTQEWDVKLGRQRINWGINTIWNPNDIFNTYNFLDFDYEERPGNDAVRIQRFFNINSTLEMAFKLGKNKDESVGAFLYKFNKNKYDFQILGGVFQTDFVLGGGWAGGIRNTGFKGELSYFHPQTSFSSQTGTISLSIMADQTFKNDWYVAVSGLFNSNATNAFNQNTAIFSSNLSAKSLFPYRYTFFVNATKSFSPISTLSFSCIYSPEKNALILFPSYSYNVAKNFDLDFTAQSFLAKVNDVYKSLGTSFFIRGKCSF